MQFWLPAECVILTVAGCVFCAAGSRLSSFESVWSIA